MRNLIITQTIGEGHNFIAKAIESALTLRGEECKVIQLYGYSEREVKKQNKLFLNLTKYFPRIYSWFWFKYKKRTKQSPNVFVRSVIKKCSSHVLKEIEAYSPDNIICTHNNAGALISYFKESKQISSEIKTYGVATDYCACPCWESCTKLDYLFTPHEFTHLEYVERGFTKEQLLPFGIPVAPKFLIEQNKAECKKYFGLDENKFTVCVLGGGNCLTKASTLLKVLLEKKFDIQFIVITGKNKKQFNAVEKLKNAYPERQVVNLGFCECMEKVFSAGDVLFTRGGGCGITEQIVKNIPIVFREGLIINERVNKSIFTDFGASLSMERLSDAPKILKLLLENGEMLEKIKERQRLFRKENSVLNIVDFIVKTQRSYLNA